MTTLTVSLDDSMLRRMVATAIVEDLSYEGHLDADHSSSDAADMVANVLKRLNLEIKADDPDGPCRTIRNVG